MADPTFGTGNSFGVLYTLNGTDENSDFGKSVSSAGDVNGDGFDDLIIGDQQARDFRGTATIISGQSGAVLHVFEGIAEFDQFGVSVSDAGDVNNDGFDDVIVGSLQNDAGGTDAGNAIVFSGVDGSVLHTFNGESAFDEFGQSVSGVGDINGDGYADVIVGALGDDNNGTLSGSATVFSGFDGMELFSIDGPLRSRFGTAVSEAGDYNNDGTPDFAVGANGVDLAFPILNVGQVTVYSGVDGSVLGSFLGTVDSQQLGLGVSGAGDVNNDGYDDVIGGAPFREPGGTTTGSAFVYSGFDNSILFTIIGDENGSEFGRSVSGAGDINGDGFDDILIGAAKNDANGNSAGLARIISGFDQSVLFTFFGEGSFDQFGTSVSDAGDVNGDGMADIIVGARNNGEAGTGYAAVYGMRAEGGVGGIVTYTEGDDPVILDDEVNLVDADFDALNGGDGNYAGGTLVLERLGGPNPGDHFIIEEGSLFSISEGALVDGNGDAFGFFIEDAGTFTITFSSAQAPATSALVDEVASNISYRSTEGIPPASVEIGWTFSDGTGADTGITTVNVVLQPDDQQLDDVPGSDLFFQRANGNFFVANGQQGVFADGIGRAGETVEAFGDLNGDGVADTILSRAGTGNHYILDHVSDTVTSLGRGTDDVIAALDTNGDGTTETLFKRDGGGFYLVEQSFFSFGFGRADSIAEAVGDFDGDGGEDILFQRGTGGYFWADGDGFGTTTGLNRDALDFFVGVGDFDGDGAEDLLFQRVSNEAFAAFDNNGNLIKGYGRSSQTVEGIGDFNGDGVDDLLMRDPTGPFVTVDGTNGDMIGFTNDLGTVVAVGDFDPGGADEFILENPDGTYSAYDGTAARVIDYGRMAEMLIAPDPLNTGVMEDALVI